MQIGEGTLCIRGLLFARGRGVSAVRGPWVQKAEGWACCLTPVVKQAVGGSTKRRSNSLGLLSLLRFTESPFNFARRVRMDPEPRGIEGGVENDAASDRVARRTWMSWLDVFVVRLRTLAKPMTKRAGQGQVKANAGVNNVLRDRIRSRWCPCARRARAMRDERGMLNT